MNASAVLPAALRPWLAAYDAQPSPSLDWLRALKFAAWERLERRGFPTLRDEAWRHTPIGDLLKTSFGRPNGVEPPLARIRQLAFDGAFAGQEIVFINGRFAAELSTLHPASGVVISAPVSILIGAVLAEVVEAGRCSFAVGEDTLIPTRLVDTLP